MSEKDIKKAVEWALKQYVDTNEFGKMYVENNGYIDSHLLVDFVRKYFNKNNISYDSFSYNDLKPFL